MTTDDELRELIALGAAATGKPFRIQASLTDIDYVTTAANIAPEIAAELIAAREEIQRLRRSLESIANLGLQVLPVDKRWGTAFAFAKDALKGGEE